MGVLMRRWALVVGETISTVVEQDGKPSVDGEWIEIVGVYGPGDAALDGLMFRAGSPELAQYLAERDKQKGSI
jgi:ribosomal protein S16